MSLGQKIKKLRTEKNLTQKDLADQLHVTFQTVSKWENDENEPDVSTLIELAKLFECSLDYLLSEENDRIVDAEVVEEPKAIVENEPTNNEIVEPSPTTVTNTQKEVHYCEHCHKAIADNELTIENVESSKNAEGGTVTTTRQVFYHKSCFDKIKEENAEEERKAKSRKRNGKAVFWGIFAGLLGLAVSFSILFGFAGVRDLMDLRLSIPACFVIGYGLFAEIYCVISSSVIRTIFLKVVGWTIKLPHLIVSLSFGGVFWLIIVKVIFAILGFISTVILLVLAIIFTTMLSMIAFPIVLIRNIFFHY